MHLCYESYRFEPREALFSPGVAYPDAYADKPGHDVVEQNGRNSFPQSVNPVAASATITEVAIMPYATALGVA